MDHRGDLYAVGVLAYELLTGRLPFPGAEPDGHVARPMPPSRRQRSRKSGVADWVPEAVERVVMRCLAKDPADRPQSAHELATEYETALADGRVRRCRRRPRSRPTTPTVADEPFQPLYVAPPDDPNSILFTFQAWMPAADGDGEAAGLRPRRPRRSARQRAGRGPRAACRAADHSYRNHGDPGSVSPSNRGQSSWRCTCSNRPRAREPTCRFRPGFAPATARQPPMNSGVPAAWPISQSARLFDGADGSGVADRLKVLPSPALRERGRGRGRI